MGGPSNRPVRGFFGATFCATITKVILRSEATNLSPAAVARVLRQGLIE